MAGSIPFGDLGFERFSSLGVPSYEDVLAGRDMIRYQKVPVRIKSCAVRVFDMMDESQRKDYSTLMGELLAKSQASACMISRNELQVMQVGGDSHWFRYVEYIDYEIDEFPAAHVGSTSSGIVRGGGVMQEVGL